MLSNFRPISLLLRRVFALTWFGAVVAGGAPVSSAAQQSNLTASGVSVEPGVLKSFEEIWQIPAADQQRWYRVQLDYDVYYYDPLWKALWGRCGDQDNYISLGPKPFPIQVGQRVRIEGKIQPSRGMLIDEPSVTVLEDSVPLEVVSTAGDVTSIQRFNKRLVTAEGYVDRQVVRDANHLELHLLVEGRLVIGQLFLQNDVTVPQFQGALVKAQGVYFGRSEPNGLAPKIELWIQKKEDVTVLGELDRDPRFALPAVKLEELVAQPSNSLVRVVGKFVARQVGKTLTLRHGDAEVVLQTHQTLPVQPGDEIEAIGYPANKDGAIVLQDGLYRPTQPLITSGSQFWALSDAEQQKWQRVKIEHVVYYYDPLWKTMWGRSGESNDYFTIADPGFPIKSGQKILIEGLVCPAKGMTVEDSKVTVLDESVPLVAVSTRGHIGETQRFNHNFVSVEGYVDRQVVTDRNHLALDLVAEGRPVLVRILVPEGATPPKLEGALVRLTGVYSSTVDPTGGPAMIEIWTSGTERVETLGWLNSDRRFDIPRTPIDRFGEVSAGQLVRIDGTVRTQQPGKSATIRDETGQVVLLTGQSKVVQLGERVEAIGYPVFDGDQWSLRDGLYRISTSAPPVPAAGLPKLRLADQLRELQPEEAIRSYPVQLSGVVTWVRPNSDFFFIRDVSGGVCVYRPANLAATLLVGTKVEVTGVSAPGKFTSVVLAADVQAFATVELPEPRTVTLEQALTGIEEAQWVSMSGYVRAVERVGALTRLDLTTSGGEFQVMMPPNDRWAKLPGSVVRVRGVCSAIANDKRQLTGIQVWVAHSRFLDIEDAAPTDPFLVAERSIASLRQFNSVQALNRRVRVAGIVVHQSPGRLINIQEGMEGLLVLSRATDPLVPGDRIEAVGFPGRESNRLVLREAVYRKVESGEEPTPWSVESLDPIDAERDGLLARAEGVVVETGTQEKGTRVILQNGSAFFEALIDRPKSELPDTWMPGSRLELTGVYEIEFDEYRRPHAVRLQLRDFSDVRVLRRPSGLTVKRVMAVTGALAVCVVLGFSWVLGLRRQVRRQTDVIREQVENEKAARLDAALARASKLESVGVLAGGIAHDFNNLLTVVIGNLSLARMDEKIDAETIHCLDESEKAAARAKDLTQQLLTFAKGGEPMRISTQLPDIVRESTQFGLHGSNVRSEFEIAPDLWLAEVDKGQIAQVVHNLIINASQAMPAGGLIRIALCNEEVQPGVRLGLAGGRYVKLRISDTGVGIPQESLTRIFDPYFTTKSQGSGLGLATVYSIVKKHQGHIDVQSKVGEGTTFNVWLPAAPVSSTTSASTESASKKTGRVLIMDDEVSIRQLGSAVIKRMGLDVTAVNDGAAVVNEYAAANAAGRPYDLVILDLTVPGGMGGAEAMERLRRMDDGVRAIVSSGYSSDPVMANHVIHGFCGRVPKPYTATELIDVVSSVMKTTRFSTRSIPSA